MWPWARGSADTRRYPSTSTDRSVVTTVGSTPLAFAEMANEKKVGKAQFVYRRLSNCVPESMRGGYKASRL